MITQRVKAIEAMYWFQNAPGDGVLGTACVESTSFNIAGRLGSVVLCEVPETDLADREQRTMEREVNPMLSSIELIGV